MRRKTKPASSEWMIRSLFLIRAEAGERVLSLPSQKWPGAFEKGEIGGQEGLKETNATEERKRSSHPTIPKNLFPA